MNALILKKHIGENWIKVPAQIFGADDTGVNATIMDRFTGLVLDRMRAGSNVLPTTKIVLPNYGESEFSISWASTMSITSPIKICIGFIMIDNHQIFNDGEYRIDSIIAYDNIMIAAYECLFSIENNLITNFTWRNSGDASNPLIIRDLQFNSNSKCFPVIFAFNDSEEFTNKYSIDEEMNNLLYDYGIYYANWVKPFHGEVNIDFVIDEMHQDEFVKPNNLIGNNGNKVTLPDYKMIFCKNFIPLKWRIENVEYPLGGTYTLPTHDVTAELIYEAKSYCGVII